MSMPVIQVGVVRVAMPHPEVLVPCVCGSSFMLVLVAFRKVWLNPEVHQEARCDQPSRDRLIEHQD